MGSRSFTVLLVSNDRALLRRLSRFLSVSGYDVQQVADFGLAAAAWEAAPPDFAIVDAEANPADALKLVREMAQRGLAQARCYTFLLPGSPHADELGDALEAGADDFLTKPIVYAELLARLRAGARELEFERRWNEQFGVETVTRLPGRAAFEGRLKAELSSPETKTGGAACILVELDFLRRITRLNGETAGAEILQDVATRLGTLCDGAGMLASFGGGTFAFLVNGLSEVEAAAWADRLRGRLADEDFACGEQQLRLTCSIGVTAVHGNAVRTAEDVLRQANEALQVAKTCGRNCVVRFAETEEDAKVWADFAAPGKLFERTVARDIMTPCPCTLRPGDSAGHAAELLRRTRLGAIAVVDADGRLLGLATDRGLLSDVGHGHDASANIGDMMLSDVPVYEEDASLATLREFFQRDSRFHVVITRDQRPVGIVNLNNLGVLGSKLTTGSFLPAMPSSPAGDYLVVPDLCPAAEQQA